MLNLKHVTFARAMPPQHAGDRRLLPADLAARLEREGAIEPNPPDWPPHAKPAPAAKPRKRYFTK